MSPISPKKKAILNAFLLAFILATLLSWILKYELTPLIFNGITFAGKSRNLKGLFLSVEIFIFTFLLYFPSSYLINPLKRFLEQLKIKYPILNKINSSLFSVTNIVIFVFVIFSGLIIGANILMIKPFFSVLPGNGKITNNELPQLIKSAGLIETVNFVSGKFSEPLEMNVIISTEIITSLGIEIDFIKDRLRPFQSVIVDNHYETELNFIQFEGLAKTSKYRTWHQINGNLYYYFLPIESPETYYIVKYKAHIIFMPKPLYDSLGMENE